MKLKDKWQYENNITDVKDSSFNITINLSIFKVAIQQDPKKMRVDFSKANTFRSLLGFRSK